MTPRPEIDGEPLAPSRRIPGAMQPDMDYVEQRKQEEGTGTRPERRAAEERAKDLAHYEDLVARYERGEYVVGNPTRHRQLRDELRKAVAVASQPSTDPDAAGRCSHLLDQAYELIAQALDTDGLEAGIWTNHMVAAKDLLGAADSALEAAAMAAADETDAETREAADGYRELIEARTAAQDDPRGERDR